MRSATSRAPTSIRRSRSPSRSGGTCHGPGSPRYASAQILGATVAALALRATLGPDADLGVTQPAGYDLQSFAWEVVLTFFLMLVITAVATDIRAVGQAAALAIGGTVALGALVGGPISGASMNPARSIGPAIVSGDLAHLWIYIAAPILGAALGTLAYRYLRGGHLDPDVESAAQRSDLSRSGGTSQRSVPAPAASGRSTSTRAKGALAHRQVRGARQEPRRAR